MERDNERYIPHGTDESEDEARRADECPPEPPPNPPHTTTGKITSPKFGSAGSGGLEYESGLKWD